MQRCHWCGTDPIYVKYHDTEWGVPVTDDKVLFEYLTLEGAQAGLSWITILKRREDYRNAFYNFNAEKVASMTKKDIQKLLTHSNIIKNKLKIESAITNAQAFLKIQEEFGSFSLFQWQFVDGEPIQNSIQSPKDYKATSLVSDQFSLELKRYGFKFVGSTIIYAHMQATGMVNDHHNLCFRKHQVPKLLHNE